VAKLKLSLGVKRKFVSAGNSFTISIHWLSVYKKGKVAARLKKIKPMTLLINGETA